jgi:hypothetical protein
MIRLATTSAGDEEAASSPVTARNGRALTLLWSESISVPLPSFIHWLLALTAYSASSCMRQLPKQAAMASFAFTAAKTTKPGKLR